VAGQSKQQNKHLQKRRDRQVADMIAPEKKNHQWVEIGRKRMSNHNQAGRKARAHVGALNPRKYTQAGLRSAQLAFQRYRYQVGILHHPNRWMPKRPGAKNLLWTS
jgi:hypothetical protein